MGALCKAMEKQDDHLKIPEARLTSKTYYIRLRYCGRTLNMC